MNIALIKDHNSKQCDTINEWLRPNHEISIITSMPEAWRHGLIPDFDLVIPMISSRRLVQTDNNPIDILSALEGDGVLSTNSSRAILLSQDKHTTHKKWQRIGLSQPKTYQLKNKLGWPKRGQPLILKPNHGSEGKHVQLVYSLREARSIARQWSDDALLQEYLHDPVCLRVIATPSSVLSAYEKVLPGALVKNIGLGATRKKVELDANTRLLAQNMVAGVGGGIMGVDILIKNDRAYALEANASFGIDSTDQQLRKSFISFIQKMDRR